MAAVFQIASSNAGVAIAASSTNFSTPATCSLVVNAAEADSLIKYRTAGTITNLRLRLKSGNRTADHVVVLRNAGTDVGGNDIAYTSTPGEFEDTSGTNSVAAGDTISYRLKSGGSGNSNYTFTYVGCNWAATNDTTCHYATTGALVHSAVSETSYRNPAGQNNKTTTQANGEWKVKLPSGVSKPVFKNLYLRISANTSTNTSTISVNGLTGTGGNNTAPTVTVPAGGGASVQEDSTNSKDATDGDQVSFKCVGGATVNFTVQTCAIEVSTGGDGVFWFVNGNNAGQAYSVTNSRVAIGGLLQSTTTELDVQSKFGLSSYTLSLLTIQVSSAGASSTLTLRAGAANVGTPGNVSVSTGSTGWTTDATNTYSPASTDELNTNWVKTNNATVTCIAIAVQAGNQNISSSDTGSGADAGESVSAGPSDTDTGSGADAGEALAATDAETGSGADAGEALALSGVSDTGSGADAGETFDRIGGDYGGGGFDPGDLGVIATPDAPGLNISGDIDLRLLLVAGTIDANSKELGLGWGALGGGGVLAKDGGAGDRGFGISLFPVNGRAGTFQLWVSSDGSGGDFTRHPSSSGSGSPELPVPFSPGQPGWIRVAFRPVYLTTDHEVKFYTSTDYDPIADTGTWTQLGVTYSNAAGTEALFNVTTFASSGDLAVGGSTDPGANFLPYEEARILYFQMLDGIDGTPVVDLDLRDTDGATATDAQGRTWTPVDVFSAGYFGLHAAPDDGESIEEIGAEPKSDSDSGAGTDDGEALEAATSDAEAPTGTDAGEALAAETSDSESASGADAGESAAAALNDAETASGADAEALVDLSGEGEASSGADDGSIAATLGDAESSSGEDAGELIEAPLSSSDDGSGFDAEALVDLFGPVDAGSADDDGAIEAELSDAEAGSGEDDGEFIEEEGGTTPVSDSDAGSGDDDGEAVSAAASDSESASGEDAEASLAADASDSESGSGADAGESLAADASSSDQGSAADAGEALAASPSDAEDGSGLDAGESLQAPISDAESGSSSEAESLAAATSDSESGQGLDAAEAVAAAVAGAESGSGADAELAIGLGDDDSGSGSETEDVSFVIEDSDAGSGEDAVELVLASLLSADAGLALDAGELIEITVVPDAEGVTITVRSSGHTGTARARVAGSALPFSHTASSRAQGDTATVRDRGHTGTARERRP